MSKRYTPESELPLRDPSPRGGHNVIYPDDRNSSSARHAPPGFVSPPVASPVPYNEIKQFKKHMVWVVPSFIVACIAMFVITMYVNDCPKNSVSCVAEFLGRFSFQPMKENPLLGPSSSTLEKLGALDVDKVVNRHQVWRLFTCIWLHGGVFHILANMLSLLVIGIRLEQEFGFVRIGLIYIISGLGGSLLSALFIQTNISVGASGALFGLLGSMLSELITNWTIYENKFSVLVTLVIIITINLAVGILPHVDNFAHIGGFLSGFLLGFIFLLRPHFGWVSQASAGAHSRSRRSKFKKYQWFLCIVALIIIVVWFVAGMIMLLRDVNLNDHCSWCHHLSCIETSLWNCNNENISCLSEQSASQITLTCSNNNKTSTYDYANPSTSQIQGLCTQLCR